MSCSELNLVPYWGLFSLRAIVLNKICFHFCDYSPVLVFLGQMAYTFKEGRNWWWVYLEITHHGWLSDHNNEQYSYVQNALISPSKFSSPYGICSKSGISSFQSGINEDLYLICWSASAMVFWVWRFMRHNSKPSYSDIQLSKGDRIKQWMFPLKKEKEQEAHWHHCP